MDPLSITISLIERLVSANLYGIAMMIGLIVQTLEPNPFEEIQWDEITEPYTEEDFNYDTSDWQYHSD